MQNENVVVKPPPKKRGRKPKIKQPEDENSGPPEVKVPKKRGRKPKGGKIITNTVHKTLSSPREINIILHLKCNSSDLGEHASLLSGVKTFSENNSNISFMSVTSLQKNTSSDNIYQTSTNTTENNDCHNNEKCDIKAEIHKKIQELAVNLHTNNISNKKSACFWCSCHFDNPPIYIPKYKMNDTYHCYGCFCAPECATSFLFKEPINTSLMFKRYHLLNFIYGKIYNYTKNFKPAPDPYYTLDKYYGNLTIDEYRKLSDNNQLLFIVDKPLTRVLPELHEDNEEFILNNHSIPSSNKYTLRKKQKKSQSQIMCENFNLAN